MSKRERKQQRKEKVIKKEKRHKNIVWSIVSIAALTYLFLIGQLVLNLI